MRDEEAASMEEIDGYITHDRDADRVLTKDYGYIRVAEASCGLKPAPYRCASEVENGE